MSPEKSLAAIIVILALRGEGRADDAQKDVQKNMQAQVTHSDGFLEFSESRTEYGGETAIRYTHWADIARIALEWKSPDTSVRIEAYDDNNDHKIDLITIKSKRYDDERSVTLYRGPAHLEHMVATHGDRFRGNRRISGPEIGVVEYPDSSGQINFYPNNSPVFRRAFTVMDRTYAGILLSVAHSNEASTRVPRIPDTYYPNIQKLLTIPSMP